jgi:nucleoside 2-deoxyribosyltransferase
MTVKIYLAARYSRREEMERIALELINAYGYDITSEWVFGGEEGKTDEDIAVMDLEHLDEADTILSFTETGEVGYYTGGRHIEHGYAIAKGKRLVVIGPRENVFHYLPGTEQFDTLRDFLVEEDVYDDEYTAA